MFGFPVTCAGGEYKIVEGLADRRLQPGAASTRRWPSCWASRTASSTCCERGAHGPRAARGAVRRRRGARALPVCDHYSGVEARMRKSLELQAELGPVFDVTLDGEDGAPVGGEHRACAADRRAGQRAGNRFGRVGVRVLPVGTRPSRTMVATVVGRAGARVAYLMIPKPRGLADLQRACDAVDGHARAPQPIPLHALVETHGALREVQALAAHPRIESLSFGLMDFVSAHRGAIPPRP
jgi:citrate lyase subunit beta / citryl-CoA lyase